MYALGRAQYASDAVSMTPSGTHRRLGTVVIDKILSHKLPLVVPTVGIF